MGDRRYIEIKEGADAITLYTHWAGTRAPAVVADALTESGLGKHNYHGDDYSLAQFAYQLLDEFRSKGHDGSWSSCGLTLGRIDQNEENPTIRIDLQANMVTIDEVGQWPLDIFANVWPTATYTDEAGFWDYVRAVGSREAEFRARQHATHSAPPTTH